MCHVLVIEDEWMIAEHVCDLLHRSGATSIATACSQDEAIAAADEHVPGIIVSDVKLSEGTGPLAVKEIHSRYGAIPVIFLTGTPEACDPCDPPGIVLSKPINERLVMTSFRSMAPLAE